MRLRAYRDLCLRLGVLAFVGALHHEATRPLASPLRFKSSRFVYAQEPTDESEQETTLTGEQLVEQATKRLFPPQSGLPDMTADEVAEHCDASSAYVCVGNGVFDVTSFLTAHPGGRNRLLLAAGGRVEPFWAQYNHPPDRVVSILEPLRVGNISDEELRKLSQDAPVPASGESDNNYTAEPRRNRALLVHAERPFNAEPPGEMLSDSFLTPPALFYVRNHFAVPAVDPATFRLKVELEEIDESGNVTIRQLGEVSLDELARMPQSAALTTLQCAGNRRKDMSQVRPVSGLEWRGGAMGTALWAGVPLWHLLLKHFKLSESELRAQGIAHVQMFGLDVDANDASECFRVSVPLDKVLALKGDVLLATHMNGAALPRDHGFPLRAIVPGFVGARNVKWLGTLRLARAEVESRWQTGLAYKGLPPNVDWQDADPSRRSLKELRPINELPVQSVITLPCASTQIEVSLDTVSNVSIPVSGVAYSGGGRRIERVEVSADGGQTWHSAKLRRANEELAEQTKKSPQIRQAVENLNEWSRCWAWSLWHCDVTLPDHVIGELLLQRAKKEHERGAKVTLTVKATDDAYNTQPRDFSSIFNVRGVLGNAWHCVDVVVVAEEEDDDDDDVDVE
ncbi:MAG: hypothetical protein MHM6MM_000065 [Cercozoa sp. M6MM]